MQLLLPGARDGRGAGNVPPCEVASNGAVTPNTLRAPEASLAARAYAAETAPEMV